MNDRFAWLKFLVFSVVGVVISIGIAAVIGNWSLEDRTTYAAELTNVQGLVVNDAVKISGVTVGKVTGIEATEQGTAMVTFEVDDDVEVTQDTIVSIRWRDVFGLRFLYLDPGDGAVVGADAEPFPLDQTRSSADLTALLGDLVPVLNALDADLQNQVLQALSEGLVGQEAEVQAIISDGANLTEALASRDAEIESLVTNATTVIEAYSQRRDDLQALVSAFADVSESIAARNDTLVNSVVAAADAQEDLDRLLRANDTNLRAALDEAELIVDIVANRSTELEDVLETSGEGFVSYHRISRLGQWFNINFKGSSLDYDTQLATTDGADLPPKDESAGGQSQAASAERSSASSFFRLED